MPESIHDARNPAIPFTVQPWPKAKVKGLKKYQTPETLGIPTTSAICRGAGPYKGKVGAARRHRRGPRRRHLFGHMGKSHNIQAEIRAKLAQRVRENAERLNEMCRDAIKRRNVRRARLILDTLATVAPGYLPRLKQYATTCEITL